LTPSINLFRSGLKVKKIKIAIVDKLPFTSWYSLSLAKELANLLREKNLLFLYGPRDRDYKAEGNVVYRKVWSLYLYPFQIALQAVKDRIRILHIQFEFITFGPFYTSPLLIILLPMLKLLRIKTIVTLHGPIFPKYVEKEIISVLTPRFIKVPKILLSSYIWLIYWLISKLASAVIVHANVFKRWLAEQGIHNCFVIPHGVDINFLHNARVNLNGKKIISMIR